MEQIIMAVGILAAVALAAWVERLTRPDTDEVRREAYRRVAHLNAQRAEDETAEEPGA